MRGILSSSGPRVGRRKAHGPGGTAETSLRRRPITLTGGRLQAWAARVLQLRNRGFTFSTRNYSRPARVGIAPIKDILGREVVSSNRRAVDRSWRVRSNAAASKGTQRRNREVEASEANRAGDRGCQNLRWKGRLPQLKGAGSW